MAVNLLRDSPSSALYCYCAAQKRFFKTACSLLVVFSGISVMKDGVINLGILLFLFSFNKCTKNEIKTGNELFKKCCFYSLFTFGVCD